jgi:hypothetical protein
VTSVASGGFGRGGGPSGGPRRLLANDICSSGDQAEYMIIEPFTAVEATAPPAEVHGRDELC